MKTTKEEKIYRNFSMLVRKKGKRSNLRQNAEKRKNDKTQKGEERGGSGRSQKYVRGREDRKKVEETTRPAMEASLLTRMVDLEGGQRSHERRGGATRLQNRKNGYSVLNCPRGKLPGCARTRPDEKGEEGDKAINHFRTRKEGIANDRREKRSGYVTRKLFSSHRILRKGER